MYKIGLRPAYGWDTEVYLSRNSNRLFLKMGQDGKDSTDWQGHECFIISNQRSQAIRKIFLEKTWGEMIEENQHTELECMLLSQSNTVDDMVAVDERVIPRDEWSFVNVMLIERYANEAERLGMGVVHEPAWIVCGSRGGTAAFVVAPS